MAAPVPTGIASAADMVDEYARMNFMVKQLMGRNATAAIVQVQTVDTGAKTVSVKALVLQTDGAGRTVDASVMYNVPYFRMQGGVNAFISDPAPQDIGLAVFASHDTSKVKNTKAEAPPGSRRRFSWSDGFYFGGFLNGTPENFVMFDTNGDIHLKPATKVYVQGDVDVTGDVVANGISLTGHGHTGVQTGEGTSGGPVAL